MPRPSSSIRVLIVAVAVALVFVPLPRRLVEAWYSEGLYPRLQGVVTPVSNVVPVAVLDLAAGMLILAGLWMGVRALRRHRLPRALAKGLRRGVVGGAAAYLLFLAMWGLNYQRVPLEASLDYDAARVTREAAIALGAEAVRQINAQRAGAMIRPLDETALAAALTAQLRSLGATRAVAIGRPKPSLLGLYFRRAAIDGMVNPYFLEIILNPDLLPMERPMVIAHEWAHLAGYAHETEASFLAWLACLQGDPMARYSAWLSAYEHASSALTPADRRALPPLADGPRDDLRAMAARYHRSSPAVRTAARDVYDSYLRAHRVPEGIASYGAVVRLMLGVQYDDDRRPRLRPR
jgi:hypothetical protein